MYLFEQLYFANGIGQNAEYTKNDVKLNQFVSIVSELLSLHCAIISYLHTFTYTNIMY